MKFIRIPDEDRWLAASWVPSYIYSFLIREYRLAIGMSLGDVARAAKRTVSWVSSIEVRGAKTLCDHYTMMDALPGLDRDLFDLAWQISDSTRQDLESEMYITKLKELITETSKEQKREKEKIAEFYSQIYEFFAHFANTEMTYLDAYSPLTVTFPSLKLNFEFEYINNLKAVVRCQKKNYGARAVVMTRVNEMGKWRMHTSPNIHGLFGEERCFLELTPNEDSEGAIPVCTDSLARLVLEARNTL